MIIEIILICLIGTLLHFTYEMSHHNKVVAYFSAVNESTWEHIKIGLTPTLLSIPIDLFILETNNLIFAKFMSLLLIIFLIPLIFYSYIPFTKKSVLPLDVLSFYVTITISQIVSFYIMNKEALNNIYNIIGIVGILVIIIIYSIFSYFAPKMFIFKDPITKKYGLEGHPCHEHGHSHVHKHDHHH